MDQNPQSVIEQLIRSGMSEAQIASALTEGGTPITQPTVHRIKKGASTSFEIGCALVRLAHSRIKPGKRGNIALSA